MLGRESCMKFLIKSNIVLYASLCINDPSAYVELQMFCRKRRIWKQMFPPVVPDGSTDRLESALMTLHPRHVYKNDIFIDHTHW